jgi:hypothetical protein
VILGGTGFKTMFLDVENIIISISGISTVHSHVPEAANLTVCWNTILPSLQPVASPFWPRRSSDGYADPESV